MELGEVAALGLVTAFAISVLAESPVSELGSGYTSW
jgi:hypothetical protein